MNRIASVMVMHARERMWLVPAFVMVAGFIICFFLAVFLDALLGHLIAGGTYTGAVAGIYLSLFAVSIGTVTGTFPFAVGFGIRRKDFFLGTLATSVVISAAVALILGLLSLIEADVIKNWGVNLHFFHLPVFSDGAPLRQFCWTTYCSAQTNPGYFRNISPLPQFWAYFALLLFMYQLGLLIGTIYQRFGRVGEYIFFGSAFLLLSALVLVSSYAHWWGGIGDWFAQQTAASLGLWLMPVMACCALASYALLRKAPV
jgi:hypothetical protein